MATPNDHQSSARSRGPQERARVLDLVDAGFRYAFSLTHRRQDAEDLVQQACLQILRRKGTSVEKGYLFATIRNLFRDSCRRRAVVSFESLSDDPNESDGALRKIEDQLDLESMLSTLPSDDRELLYLKYIEGFTAQEIGELTGRPRGTILSQLSRAKQKLSDRFRVPSGEEGGSR